MCTITWTAEQLSYEIFFNRDELKTRAKASPPQIYKQNGISTIFPLDPDGSGTWIFINDRGISAALLNYNVPLEKREYKSRGTLLTEICFESDRDKMLQLIIEKKLEQYRGFTLCLFEPGTQPFLYRWNGKEITPINENQPIVSSSYKLKEVRENRKMFYKSIIAENGNSNSTHLEFHKSHIPEKSYRSTCMHRADAETISFSQISCDEKSIRFTYMGTSPCRDSTGSSISLKRWTVD